MNFISNIDNNSNSKINQINEKAYLSKIAVKKHTMQKIITDEEILEKNFDKKIEDKKDLNNLNFKTEKKFKESENNFSKKIDLSNNTFGDIKSSLNVIDPNKDFLYNDQNSLDKSSIIYNKIHGKDKIINSTQNKKLSDIYNHKKKENNKKFTSNKSLNYNSDASSYKSIKLQNLNSNDIDLNSNLKCLICDWEYPIEMSLDEKNAHINFCLEGEGNKHKSNFLSSLKLIQIAANGNINLEDDKKKELNKNKNSNVCPFCSKTINLKNGKTLDNHLMKCYIQQEQEILFTSKKRKKMD